MSKECGENFQKNLELSIINRESLYLMTNSIQEQTHEELKELLKQSLTPEQIAFGQAVSVCSVVVDLGLIKASIEDVVEGLYERFQGLCEKQEIRDTAEAAIEFGLNVGLFEYHDQDSFTLSSSGLVVGKDWLNRIKACPK